MDDATTAPGVRFEGDATFELRLNAAVITVDGRTGPDGPSASLQSPLTSREAADDALVARALFGRDGAALVPMLPPIVARAGFPRFASEEAGRGLV